MAAAMIDRLVHHCHIVTIRGNSYRIRQQTDLWHALQTDCPGRTRKILADTRLRYRTIRTFVGAAGAGNVVEGPV